MKIGYSTWGMPTVPVDTFVPFLARLGYDGIELTVIPGYTTELSKLDAAERRRIAGMLNEHHLALPALAPAAPPDPARGLAACSIRSAAQPAMVREAGSAPLVLRAGPAFPLRAPAAAHRPPRPARPPEGPGNRSCPWTAGTTAPAHLAAAPRPPPLMPPLRPTCPLRLT